MPPILPYYSISLAITLVSIFLKERGDSSEIPISRYQPPSTIIIGGWILGEDDRPIVIDLLLEALSNEKVFSFTLGNIRVGALAWSALALISSLTS